MSGGVAAGLLTGRKVLLCHIRLLVQVICVQVYPANQNGIIPNMTSEIIVQTAEELIELGATLGSLLRGGETIELVGDIGAGKTTLTKGLARGMGIAEEVQSPTFTLSRVYDAPNGRRLAHYDFYRLNNAGIMQAELAEVVQDARTVTVIEWAAVVGDVLPDDTLRITICVQADDTRRLELEAGGECSKHIVQELMK